MVPLTSTASPAASIKLKPSFIPSLTYTRDNQLEVLRQRRLRGEKCKPEFSVDAPVAVTIVVCILNYLIFPVAPSPEDVEAESLIDSDDARPNLSISPDVSWLPIASILLCIAHIQLEASIKNGDLQDFQLFNEAAKRFSSLMHMKNDRNHEEDRKKDRRHNLSSASGNFRNQIKGWNGPQEIVQDEEHSSEVH